MAANVLAAATGRHEVLPIATSPDKHAHFIAMWRRLVRESTTAKRAPPPVEDTIDLVFYGVLALLFVQSVW